MENRMFKITPPTRENVSYRNFLLYALLVLCAGLIIWLGYRQGAQTAVPESRPEDGQPVNISKALFFNHDSLTYYAALAYKDDDPKGLFVLGMTYYLRVNDPDFLPDFPNPDKDEADIMLLHAADLGYPDAIQFIHCMHNNGCWNHSLPEDKVTLQ